MKKYIIIFLILVVIIPQPTYAHSPSAMRVIYDPSSKLLSVAVSHPVVNPRTHFIRRIEVIKNGIVIAERQFIMQYRKVLQQYKFELENVNPNDTISVIAYCNISGEIEKSGTLNSFIKE